MRFKIFALGIQTSEFPLLISLVLEFLLIYYRTGGLQKLALENVSLSITPGTKIVICGKSGR